MAFVEHTEVAVEHQPPHHVDLSVGRLAEQEGGPRDAHQPLGSLPDLRRDELRQQRGVHRVTLAGHHRLARVEPVIDGEDGRVLLGKMLEEA